MTESSAANNSLKSNNISADSDSEVLPRTFDRYRLLKRIARGGMGEVFLATPSATIDGAERPCVLKVIRREHIEDSSFLARFLDEARIQAQLEHPFVVRVLEAAMDSAGKPFCVFEHVEGRNLSEVRLRAQQLGITLSWPDAVAIAMMLCEGLAHVHERTDANGQPLEIVHRDLSPQNVMVAYGGDVKLIDFGTARGQNRRCHTIAGIVFAKPGYVAPEVANNNPGGIPADIYAVGIMLWEVLSGRRFLTGEASEHLTAVAAGKRAPCPIAEAVQAPPELDVILQRMTALDIGERYSSAYDALQDFIQLLKRAPSTNDGQRSVRVRISQLMHRLYPAEPTRTRAEFVRLVAAAKQTLAPASAMVPPPSPEPPVVEPPSDPDLLKGTRYRLQGELGEGATGTVYEALHLDLGRRVALKLLSQEAAANREGFERFRREAQTVAGLEHENIVTVYDFGQTEDGRAYLSMELLRGDALDQVLSRNGASEWRSAITLTIQACRALEAAHEAGIVHRDIKPANLFVTRTGLLKLLDFGIAHLKQNPESIERDPEAFIIVGTPEYMAPEQATGADPTPASDVYALGSVLYEMLTGERPYVAESIPALIDQKLTQAPIPARKRNKTRLIPRSVDRVLIRALSADPDRRFQSATSLRLALEDVLDDSATATRKQSQRVTRFATRVALVSLIGAGALWASPTLRYKSQFWANWAVNQAEQKAHLTASIPKLKKSAEAVKHYSESLLASLSERVSNRNSAMAKLEPAPAPKNDDSVTEVKPEVQQEKTAASAQTLSAASLTDLERATSWLEAGQASRALKTLRRLGNDNPQDVTILTLWGQAAEQTKAWGEARSVAEQRARADHSEEALLALVRLQKLTGQSERAKNTLQQLVKEYPDCTDARAQLDKLENKSRVALRANSSDDE